MCYNAILPTTLKAERFGNDLTSLTYIFNRWLKMLSSYGKLDESGLSHDFSVIARVIKGEGFRKIFAVPCNAAATMPCRTRRISRT